MVTESALELGDVRFQPRHGVLIRLNRSGAVQRRGTQIDSPLGLDRRRGGGDDRAAARGVGGGGGSLRGGARGSRARRGGHRREALVMPGASPRGRERPPELLALRLRVLEGIADLLVALALLRGALPESLELASRVGALRLQLPHSRRGIRGRVLVDGVEDGDERRLRGGGFGLDGVDRPYRVFVQAALLRRGAVLVFRVRARAVVVRARALLVGAAVVVGIAAALVPGDDGLTSRELEEPAEERVLDVGRGRHRRRRGIHAGRAGSFGHGDDVILERVPFGGDCVEA